MLVPVFSLKISVKIKPGTFKVGCFDGKHPSFVGATESGKVFVHNSREKRPIMGNNKSATSADKDLLYFNINQVISCVAVGKLDLQAPNDILVVGTQSTLNVYDVDRNADLLFRELPDGATSVTIGQMGTYPEPLIIAGGNCSITGFDIKGEDAFWTVTGDNVHSLCLLDFDNDGINELIVGSEDFDIRVFKNDALHEEITETDVITLLCPLEGTKFVYALANGTVGIYDGTTRFWRIKSRDIPTAVLSFDINCDGEKELLIGWSNGKVEGRNQSTGELVFNDTLGSAVAGIMSCDYQMNGKQQILVAATDGTIKGYQVEKADSSTSAEGKSLNVEQGKVRELNQQKNKLALELQSLERTEEIQKAVASGEFTAPVDAIPADTRLLISGRLNQDAGLPPHIEVAVQTSNQQEIRMAIAFADGVFEGSESYIVHPTSLNEVTNRLTFPLCPTRDVAVMIFIKAFVGLKTGTLFHVLESKFPLPKFSMYALVAVGEEKVEKLANPKGSVTFQGRANIDDVVNWINGSLLTSYDSQLERPAGSTPLHVLLKCLRDNSPVIIRVNPNGHTVIRADTIEQAGDFVIDLLKNFPSKDLATEANFPVELDKLVEAVTSLQAARQEGVKLSSEVADHANLIKFFLLRAEDCRLMGDMRAMRKGYLELHTQNAELMSSHRIRCDNHQQVMTKLKYISQLIQKSANLRSGSFKNKLISDCRTAIKEENYQTLLASIGIVNDISMIPNLGDKATTWKSR